MQKNLSIALILFLLAGSPVLAQEEKEAPSKEKTSFAEKLSFSEGTFLGKINNSIINLVEKVETWREARAAKFRESLDKVDDKREENKEAKAMNKVFNVLQLVLLAVLLFIFSLQVVFYLIGTLIVLAILRKIFGTAFIFIRERRIGN